MFMITIIGSGKVGGDAALFSALKRLDDQILLLDVAKGLPQGEAMDINHMLSEQGIDVEVKGSNDFADMKGSDIVVVVAGSGRKPGMTRMDLLKINASVVKSVVENVKKYADNSIIIPVTNPLDPMAYVTYKSSGFDKNRVFGMGGMLDLSRFRQFIHEATGHSRDSIRALVIGEHGENMLPLPRFSSVSGIPLSSFLPKEKLDELVLNTKQVAAKVIELKGATVHAPGNAISAIVESVVRDRKQVIPVATYLDGEYGHSDVTIGVPAIIGKNGVEKIIELDLNEEEKQVFGKGVENVKSAISGIEI
jgi:malate dehydrogenase